MDKPLSVDPSKLSQMTVDNELLERIRKARSSADTQNGVTESSQKAPEAAEGPVGK